MYPSTKFTSFCRTSDYETKFAKKKNMTDKKFEKINIKIENRKLKKSRLRDQICSKSMSDKNLEK